MIKVQSTKLSVFFLLLLPPAGSFRLVPCLDKKYINCLISTVVQKDN